MDDEFYIEALHQLPPVSVKRAHRMDGRAIAERRRTADLNHSVALYSRVQQELNRGTISRPPDYVRKNPRAIDDAMGPIWSSRPLLYTVEANSFLELARDVC